MYTNSLYNTQIKVEYKKIVKYKLRIIHAFETSYYDFTFF